jgi:four helix bundle protein
MNKESNLKERTSTFALNIIRLYSDMPKSEVGRILGRQLLRSGTSVGAHYREACRSRSNAEFISKVEGAMQELEESMYWIELLENSGELKSVPIELLKSEMNQLMAIFVTCVKKVKSK